MKSETILTILGVVAIGGALYWGYTKVKGLLAPAEKAAAAGADVLSGIASQAAYNPGSMVVSTPTGPRLNESPQVVPPVIDVFATNSILGGLSKFVNSLTDTAANIQAAAQKAATTTTQNPNVPTVIQPAAQIADLKAQQAAVDYYTGGTGGTVLGFSTAASPTGSSFTVKPSPTPTVNPTQAAPAQSVIAPASTLKRAFMTANELAAAGLTKQPYYA